MRLRCLAPVLLSGAVLAGLALASCNKPQPTAPTQPPTSTPTPPQTGAFTVSCSTSNVSLGWNGTSNQSCSVGSVGNFNDNVRLSCAGLPNGASCAFQPEVVRPTPGAVATLTVAYTDIVPPGSTPIQVIGTDTPGNIQSASVTLTKTIDTVSLACPSALDVSTIDAELTLSFESDPTAGQTVCSASTSGRALTRLETNVYSWLLTMRYIKFDQPLPWTPSQPYQWLIATIRRIRFRTDLGAISASCCSPANAVNVSVAGSSSWTSVQSNGRLFGNTSLLIHEARHNNGIAHTCGTKDQTIAELGAFGTQYYYLYWLADHLDSRFMTPEIAASNRSAGQSICTTQTCDQVCPLGG